jgi:hypothetical protein
MKRESAIKAPEQQERQPKNWAIVIIEITSIDVDRRNWNNR